MSSGLFRNCCWEVVRLQILYLIYLNKQNLALNNRPGLIFRKTQLSNLQSTKKPDHGHKLFSRLFFFFLPFLLGDSWAI